MENSDLRDGESEREEGERKVVSKWNDDGEATTTVVRWRRQIPVTVWAAVERVPV